jgi:chromatin remodeling complex protein RSC6
MSKKASGVMKEMHASKELQAIVKEKKISRGAVMKALWKYIKRHKLQNKDSGRIVDCDDKLSALFAKTIKHKREIKMRGKKIKVPAGSIFMTEMGGALSEHLS